MVDQFVQLAADSTGKKVDVTELTVGANTVERQRVNNADPYNPAALQTVDMEGKAYARDLEVARLLTLILSELRINNLYLSTMSGQHFDGESLI